MQNIDIDSLEKTLYVPFVLNTGGGSTDSCAPGPT